MALAPVSGWGSLETTFSLLDTNGAPQLPPPLPSRSEVGGRKGALPGWDRQPPEQQVGCLLGSEGI